VPQILKAIESDDSEDEDDESESSEEEPVKKPAPKKETKRVLRIKNPKLVQTKLN
jgi:hypothetical protein